MKTKKILKKGLLFVVVVALGFLLGYDVCKEAPIWFVVILDVMLIVNLLLAINYRRKEGDYYLYALLIAFILAILAAPTYSYLWNIIVIGSMIVVTIVIYWFTKHLSIKKN